MRTEIAFVPLVSRCNKGPKSWHPDPIFGSGKTHWGYLTGRTFAALELVACPPSVSAAVLGAGGFGLMGQALVCQVDQSRVLGTVAVYTMLLCSSFLAVELELWCFPLYCGQEVVPHNHPDQLCSSNPSGGFTLFPTLLLFHSPSPLFLRYMNYMF